MRVLIECSYVFSRPHIKSGIQRVVRNIVANVGCVKTDVPVIPVAFRGEEVLKVTRINGGFWDCALAPLKTRVEGLYSRYGALVRYFERRCISGSSQNVRRFFYLLMWLSRLVGLAVKIPNKILTVFSVRFLDPLRSETFEIQKDDVLVLLDSSWNAEFFGPIERLRSQGVKIVSVVYDLIPVTHPQFYDERMTTMFGHWLDWTIQVADGYMTISDTVRDQVRDYVDNKTTDTLPRRQWVESFYLGAELDLVSGNVEVRPQLKSLFDGTKSVYLTVSTIEPRKNHNYQLDAFDKLWAQGVDVCLCIVGKIGWKCGDLVKRIESHPELNRRLFMFNDMGDDELGLVYQKSKVLLFSSYVEGFGLPLVEAAQRGLRVMCSDIPIFKEIGQEYCAYFDLDDPSTLENLVIDYERTGIFPASDGNLGWLSWSESAQQFVNKILENTK